MEEQVRVMYFERRKGLGEKCKSPRAARKARKCISLKSGKGMRTT
jgi:hypothetical protein